MIEGVYALQQWSIDGEVFTAPRVDGRFVLMNGIAIAILHNRVAADNRHSATLYGRYRLTPEGFAYGYDDAETTTQKNGVISCSEQLPWSGMREFAVAATHAETRVYSRTGSEEFIFTRAGFTYAEHGAVLRRWRRMSAMLGASH